MTGAGSRAAFGFGYAAFGHSLAGTYEVAEVISIVRVCFASIQWQRQNGRCFGRVGETVRSGILSERVRNAVAVDN